MLYPEQNVRSLIGGGRTGSENTIRNGQSGVQSELRDKSGLNPNRIRGFGPSSGGNRLILLV